MPRKLSGFWPRLRCDKFTDISSGNELTIWHCEQLLEWINKYNVNFSKGKD